jgi:hypothetical protein
VFRGVVLDLGMLVGRDVLAPESLIETDSAVTATVLLVPAT